MTRQWMIIEERVPRPDAAISRHSVLRQHASDCSPFIQSIIDILLTEPNVPTWLVAPNRRVAHQWMDRVAFSGHPVFNVHATTPNALCFDLAAPTISDIGCTVASKQASLVLLEKVIRKADQEKKLRYFVSPRSYSQLAELMLKSLSAIRMAGLSADAVRGTEVFGQTHKGADIALLLDDYAAILREEKLLDSSDITTIAKGIVQNGQLPANIGRILRPSNLQITSLQADVFAGLGQSVQLLASDSQPASTVISSTGPSQTFFRAVGEVNEIRSVLRRCLANGFPLDTVEIVHVDAATYPPLIQEVVSVLEGVDDQNILNNQLPVTFSEGLPIRESKPARALTAWLTWREEYHPQWRLVRMIRDGLLDWERGLEQSGSNEHHKRERHDAIHNREENPCVSSSSLLYELLRLKLGFELSDALEKVKKAKESIEKLSLTAFRKTTQDSGEEEFDEEYAIQQKKQRVSSLRVLENLLCSLISIECRVDATALDIISQSKLFLENLASSQNQFDNNSKNRLLVEISDLEAWLERHPVTDPNEVFECLRKLVDSLVVMGSGPRPGCLHVAPMTTGGHSGRLHTFIVGLDEKRFPGSGNTDPILNDADRRTLDRSLETNNDSVNRAVQDFEELLARLRGDVYLSYSCRDLAQQTEVFPSPTLIDIFRRTNSAPNTTLADFLDDVVDDTESFVPKNSQEALNEAEWWMVELGENPTLESVGRAVACHSTALERGWKAEEARRSNCFTPWDGYLENGHLTLNPTHSESRVASAHSLETLGTCPRRFFFKYGLDIKPLRLLEPEEDRWLDDMEHGSILHTVLERFMSRFLFSGSGDVADSIYPTFQDHEKDILLMLDNVLEEKRLEKPTTDEAAVAAGRRELADALRTFLKAEETYCRQTGARPVALEACIGFQREEKQTRFDTVAPVSVPLKGSRSVRLRGFVDRIDIQSGKEPEHHTYSIIDYKKGRSTRFKKTGKDEFAVFDKGRRLQHGLYVLMVQHVVQETIGDDGRVTQFSYLFPGEHARGERVDWTAEELAGLTEILVRLCDIASAGAFLPTTSAEDCRFCEYLDVCGDAKQTVALSQRKLCHDDKHYGENNQTLAELFCGIQKVRSPSNQTAIHAPHPEPFDVRETIATPRVSDDGVRATIRSDLQSSFFVEASAGTGKTTCMIDRMTALVRTGVVTVNQITAITFTNKAASELARRFRQRLEKDSVDTSRTDVERQHLQKALAEIDSAIIETVHAFCGRLLRERPIEAGIDPSVKTLDAASEQVFIGRAWRVFCESVPNDPALSRARACLEETGIDLRDLRSSFETMSAHGDVKSWPYQTIEAPDIRPLMARIDSEIQERLQAVRVPWRQRGMDELMNKLEVVQRAYRMRFNDSPSSLFKAAEMLQGDCPRITQSLWLPGKRSKEHQQRQRAHKQELENWWNAIVNEVTEPLEQWYAYRYQFVVPLLQAARDCYQQLRVDEGVLSFHDLLERTAHLLRRRPDVRSVFAKKHPVILVDEFQDTDPLQAEIVLLLTADNPKETNWRLSQIIPGSLFVVGDPKQSIYRFRRADIGTFNFVKERIKCSGGRILQLHSNFRSNPELVEWINEHFAGLFEGQQVEMSEQYGPGFTASQASRSVSIPGVLTGMRQLRVRSRNVRAEAEAIATFIRRAMDRRLTVSRSSKDEDPACRPSDFMLVTWDTGQLSTYADALYAEGIPCDVTGRKGTDSKNDLWLLHLCLRVGADSDDTIAALAVLRGPLFGFSDPDLEAFHRAGGCIDGRLRVPDGLKDKILTHRFEHASKTFHRWRRLLGALPPVAAIERIINESGLLLVASSANGEAGRRGRAAIGAIATLVERLRAERNTFTSIHDVIDWMDDLVANEFPRRDFDSLSIDAEAGNAVRVMNLHKAKGLEAPVVFLCDEGSSHRHRSPSWHISRTEDGAKGYLKISREGLFGRDGKTVATPLQWSEIESEEQRYLDAESLRLLYVAGTRPGSCVVASVFESKDGEVSGGWHELFSDRENIADLPELEAQSDTDEVLQACCSNDFEGQFSDRFAALHAATFSSMTPRDFLNEHSESIRHTGQGLGQEFGTVIHSLLEMELVHVKKSHQKPDLRAAADNAIRETNLSEKGIGHEELVNRALQLVKDIQSSSTWKRICQSQNQYVEVPFTIVVARDEVPDDVDIDSGCQKSRVPTTAPVLIHGQIDAVFKDESTKPPPGMSEWIIVDWKTVSVADCDRDALATHYQPQIQLYAYCWSIGLYSQ